MQTQRKELSLAMGEVLPRKHALHASLPTELFHVPTGHAVHGPPLGPVKPILHVQAASAGLAVGEMELAGQARQVVSTVAPTVVEYVPAPQSVHTALPLSVL